MPGSNDGSIDSSSSIISNNSTNNDKTIVANDDAVIDDDVGRDCRQQQHHRGEPRGRGRGVRAWQSGLATPACRLAALHRNNRLTDLTIAFDHYKETFKVHKMVLGMSSPVLERLLFPNNSSKMQQNQDFDLQDDTLTCHQGTPVGYRWVLEHMYTGRTALSSLEEALEVYHLANQLHMDDLFLSCSQCLCGIVNAVNLPLLYNIAVQMQDHQLLNQCTQVVAHGGDAIWLSPAVQDLSHDALLDILQQQLPTTTLTVLFKALTHWCHKNLEAQDMEVNPDSLREEIKDFLPHISGTMTLQDFVTDVVPTNIFTMEQCNEILMNMAHSEVQIVQTVDPGLANDIKAGLEVPTYQRKKSRSKSLTPTLDIAKETSLSRSKSPKSIMKEPREKAQLSLTQVPHNPTIASQKKQSLVPEKKQRSRSLSFNEMSNYEKEQMEISDKLTLPVINVLPPTPVPSPIPSTPFIPPKYNYKQNHINENILKTCLLERGKNIVSGVEGSLLVDSTSSYVLISNFKTASQMILYAIVFHNGPPVSKETILTVSHASNEVIQTTKLIRSAAGLEARFPKPVCLELQGVYCITLRGIPTGVYYDTRYVAIKCRKPPHCQAIIHTWLTDVTLYYQEY